MAANIKKHGRKRTKSGKLDVHLYLPPKIVGYIIDRAEFHRRGITEQTLIFIEKGIALEKNQCSGE